MPNRLETAREKIMSRVAAANPDFEAVISYWPILWDRYPVVCCRWLSGNTLRVGWYMGTEPEPRATAALEAIAAPDGTASARLAVTQEPTLDGLVDSIIIARQSEIGPKRFNREQYQGLEIDFELSLKPAPKETTVESALRANRASAARMSARATPAIPSDLEGQTITGLAHRLNARAPATWIDNPHLRTYYSAATPIPGESVTAERERTTYLTATTGLLTVTLNQEFTTTPGIVSFRQDDFGEISGFNDPGEYLTQPGSRRVRIQISTSGGTNEQEITLPDGWESPLARAALPKNETPQTYRVVTLAARHLTQTGETTPDLAGSKFKIGWRPNSVSAGFGPDNIEAEPSAKEVELTDEWQLLELGEFTWPNERLNWQFADYVELTARWEKNNATLTHQSGTVHTELEWLIGAVFLLPCDRGIGWLPPGTISKTQRVRIERPGSAAAKATLLNAAGNVVNGEARLEGARGWDFTPDDVGKEIAFYAIGADGKPGWRDTDTMVNVESEISGVIF